VYVLLIKYFVTFGLTLLKSDCQYTTNQRKPTEFLASCTLLMSPRQYRLLLNHAVSTATQFKLYFCVYNVCNEKCMLIPRLEPADLCTREYSYYSPALLSQLWVNMDFPV